MSATTDRIIALAAEAGVTESDYLDGIDEWNRQACRAAADQVSDEELDSLDVRDETREGDDG